jgi:hypothetical protein
MPFENLSSFDKDTQQPNLPNPETKTMLWVNPDLGKKNPMLEKLLQKEQEEKGNPDKDLDKQLQEIDDPKNNTVQSDVTPEFKEPWTAPVLETKTDAETSEASSETSDEAKQIAATKERLQAKMENSDFRKMFPVKDGFAFNLDQKKQQSYESGEKTAEWIEAWQLNLLKQIETFVDEFNTLIKNKESFPQGAIDFLTQHLWTFEENMYRALDTQNISGNKEKTSANYLLIYEWDENTNYNKRRFERIKNTYQSKIHSTLIDAIFKAQGDKTYLMVDNLQGYLSKQNEKYFNTGEMRYDADDPFTRNIDESSGWFVPKEMKDRTPDEKRAYVKERTDKYYVVEAFTKNLEEYLSQSV